MARAVVRRALLAAAALAVLSSTLPASAGGGTTSEDVPTRRTQTAAVIRTTTADTLVQVNVDIGHINLPRMGDADVGVVVGTATGKDGAPMPPRSFKFDAFGHGNTGHRTGTVNGKSFMLYGFGGAKVTDGTTDGSFRTKPLWVGAYDIHIQRKGASYRCGLDIVAGEVRMDLHFGKKNLGSPRCAPMNSLAQGAPG